MILPKIPMQVQNKVSDYIQNFLEYLKQYGDNFTYNIFTSNDEEAFRNNCGWYQHINNKHIINMNVLNISTAIFFIEKGLLDIDSFYAFVTLSTAHEYRHFIQGTVSYDGNKIAEFTEKDCLANELMLYIRYFYDGYYLMNKGNIKYELDAERFGVIEGLKYLEKINPNIDAKKAMYNAIKFSTDVIYKQITSTLPRKAKDYDDAVKKLNENITINERVQNLNDSLFVYHPRFFQNHIEFGLHEEEVLTQNLINEYASLKDGFERDLLVVKRILNCLDYKEESLEQFPNLKKTWDQHYL